MLQHPRERLHPIGTERFARLGLQNASVHVAWNASDLEPEDAPPAWLREGTGLLYPASHALELGAIPQTQHPQRLLVLDGTWHTAKTLYRQKRWLQRLPHFRLSPVEPGRYRIRREPQPDYLSTIEAIVAALQIIEPNTPGLVELLRAFDGMIDAQMALSEARRALPDAEQRMKKRRRANHQRRVPHALVEGYPRLIVVYGEAARGGAEHTTEFVYFVAHAVATGARFECVVMPRAGLPADVHLEHMGLPHALFTTACSTEEFGARWAEFVALSQAAQPKSQRKAPPLIAAWNQRTLDLLGTATGRPVAPVSLKSAYRAVHGLAEFSLEAVVAKHRLTLRENGFRGRAAPRFANALAVAEFLHAGAQSAQTALNPSDAESTAY
ncbi:MAG: hypothetical protein RL701_4012 [Pseudomonadota bacterium]